jgi:hypothetical protein
VSSHASATAPPRVERRPRFADWPRVAVAVGLAGLVVAWLADPLVGGDTGPLLTGTEQLGRCLGKLDLVSCDEAQPIDPFPVLQHAPDLVADAGLELSRAGRTRVLGALSCLGVLGAIAAAFVALRRVGQAEWRWGFLVVAVSGPALAYGGATWGEMLAAGLLTVFVAAALVPARPVVVAAAAFGASLTKETSYPFVVALGVLSLLLARRRLGRSIRSHVVGCLAGVALALGLSSALNLLRFGSPRNVYYLDPGLRASDLRWFLEPAAGLFVSPNGGILVFWPLACLLVAALLAVPVVRAMRGAATWREAWPALALGAIVLGLVVSLAWWWQPFGWWAWGPRLSLPWVLPVLLVALAAFGSTLRPAAARILTPVTGLVAVSVVAVLVALPHVGYLWAPDTVGNFFFFHTTAVCPGGGPPPTPRYYDCLHEEMWARRPIWLDSLHGLRRAGGLATAMATALVVVGSLVLFRRELEQRLLLPRAEVPYRQPP